ncbi:MAG: hypothetical protein MN733_14635 [Nitrososphaera sp.]|nr:hypothetical protein [Nitrososphaera sp.]
MTEKHFSLVRPFEDYTHFKIPKSCLKCGQPVTKEVVYSIGNDMSVIERYCTKCALVVEQQQNKEI